jgi:hypothetical protein
VVWLDRFPTKSHQPAAQPPEALRGWAGKRAGTAGPCNRELLERPRDLTRNRHAQGAVSRESKLLAASGAIASGLAASL